MLWALGDRGDWANSLRAAAFLKGIAVKVGTINDPPPTDPPGLLFMRPDPETDVLGRQRDLYHTLRLAGWATVQDRLTIDSYEDKLAQTALYARWMPRTLLLTAADEAQRQIGALGFPFVSKSRTGSGSTNVRLINDASEASREVAAVFGDGLELHCAFGEERQRGYLIWQEFLPDNDGDFRIIITGRHRMILRRYNAEDRPFASGSGSFAWVTALKGRAKSALEHADEFFRAEGLKWCGIDMVRGRDGWKILETTPAWTLPGYAGCVYFDDRNRATKYCGADIWAVLLNEIKAGVFAGPDGRTGL